MECPVEILSSDHPVWSLLVALSVGMLSFSCMSHSHCVVGKCTAMPAQLPGPAHRVFVKALAVSYTNPSSFWVLTTAFPAWSWRFTKMILPFEKTLTPSQCSINNFVYQGVRENKFSQSKMQDFIECRPIPISHRVSFFHFRKSTLLLSPWTLEYAGFFCLASF